MSAARAGTANAITAVKMSSKALRFIGHLPGFSGRARKFPEWRHGPPEAPVHHLPFANAPDERRAIRWTTKKAPTGVAELSLVCVRDLSGRDCVRVKNRKLGLPEQGQVFIF